MDYLAVESTGTATRIDVLRAALAEGLPILEGRYNGHPPPSGSAVEYIYTTPSPTPPKPLDAVTTSPFVEP